MAAQSAGSAASRAELLAAAALFAFGTFLRARGLGASELWIDEYGTWWAVAGESWRDVWRRVIEIHGQSPLYYLLVRATTDALGAAPLALRLPSLVAGIALLWLGPFVALRFFGDRRVALAALAAFALDERLVFYSQNARPYALALLCATASFHCYAGLLRDPGGRSRLGWVLASAATWYVHYLFGVVLVVQAIHYLLERPHLLSRLRRDAATFAVLAVLLAPGTRQLAALHARRGDLDWVPRGGAFAGLDLALEFFDLRVLGLVAAAVLLAVALERPRSWRLAGSRPGLLLLWLGVPLLLVLIASPLLGVNVVYSRYVLVVVPAAALLYGALAGVPRDARLGWLVAAVFVSSTALLGVVPMLDGKGLFTNWYRDQRWAAATGALASRYREGDRIFYGTWFFELDAVVRGEASGAVADFAAWPVRAHLPRDRHFELHPLPYRYTPETKRLLGHALGASPGRVWIIGLSEAVRQALPLARREAGLQVEGRQKYGIVQLVLMTHPSP